MTPWGVFFLAFYNVLLVNGGTLSTESAWAKKFCNPILRDCKIFTSIQAVFREKA